MGNLGKLQNVGHIMGTSSQLKMLAGNVYVLGCGGQLWNLDDYINHCGAKDQDFSCGGEVGIG